MLPWLRWEYSSWMYLMDPTIQEVWDESFRLQFSADLVEARA
jgi:hypothetical protein